MKLSDKNCTKCDLHMGTFNVCISGEYFDTDYNDLLILGEAPSRFEEQSNKPFQGKAGGILRNALFTVGLNGYLTNSVKCRPPAYKRPTKKQIEVCRYWLNKEIEYLKPKYVILLGATALKSALNIQGMLKLRGQAIEHEDIIYFPIHHPSYIIRHPEQYDVFIQDLTNVKRYIDGHKPEEKIKTNFKIIQNSKARKKALKDIATKKWVSLDIETSGLNPFEQNAYITSIGIGTKKTQYCFVLNHRLSPYYQKFNKQQKIANQIYEALRNCKIIAQNGKFDSLWLKKIFDITIDIDFDTKLASYMINEEAKNSLNDLSVKYFNATNYDVPLDVKFGLSGSLEDHCEYLAKDLSYTYELKPHLSTQLVSDIPSFDVFSKLIMPLSNLYRDAEYQGLYIDKQTFETADKFWHQQSNEYLEKLNEYAQINWRSPDQVRQILFERLKLPVLDKTNSGAASTNESVLKRINHPVAGHLIKYRKANQNISFFIQGWHKRMDENNYIHPTFKIDGTVTGRPSCKDPNLQQTPRDPRIRSIIQAPKNWQLLEVDISQAELRIAAEMSKCPGLIRAFQQNVDVHTRIVQNTFGILQPNSEQRKKGKAINFGYLYGMGWKKFILYARDNYDTVVTESEAQKSRNTYFQTWPGLLSWHEKQREFVRSQGYVRSLIGRKRRLPNINSDNTFEVAEAERQAINSPVQSLAADWTLAAALQMRKEFDWDVARIIGTVHDSVLLIVHENEIGDLSSRAVEIMKSPDLIIKDFKLNMTVPMVAEAKIGPWGKSHTGIT